MVQILKPQPLMVNYRTINLKKKYKLVTTTIIAFSLDSGKILPENQALQKFYQEPQRVLDYGFPKSQGEIIVYGSVDIEEVKPFQAKKICVSVGPICKDALIFGRRVWKRQAGQIVMSDDEEENHSNNHDDEEENHSNNHDDEEENHSNNHVAVIPENTFGGEGYNVNPIGLGYNALEQLEYQETVPLPLVEDPDYPIQSPNDSPLPIWFSPTPFTFPERYQEAGTFDHNWLKENHPGFPDDLAPTYFNEAHPSLWLPELGMFFEGNEKVLCQGFIHDDTISGSLPNYRVRMFSCAKNEPEKSIPEIIENSVQLDTVVLIPDQLLGFCIYRSISDVGYDPLLLNLSCLMIAYERLTDDPKPFKHYADFLHRRMKNQPEIEDLLDTQSLSPILTPEEQREQIEQEIQEISQEQQKINQQKQGMHKWVLQEAELTQLPENSFDMKTTDAQVTELQHTIQSLSDKKQKLSVEEMEKLTTKVQNLTNEIVNKQVESVPDNQISLQQPPPLPRHPLLLEEEITTRFTKPAKEEIKKQLGSLTSQMSPNIDKHLDYLINARRIANEPITTWPQMTQQDSLTFGIAFTTHTFIKKDFSECDLADLNVSSHYFAQLILTSAFLERGNFASCRFFACDFTETCLVKAYFRDTIFTDCLFTKANLAETIFERCSFQNCTFNETVIQNAQLVCVIMEQGKVSQGQWSSVKAHGLQVTNMEWDDTSLVECDFSQSSWSQIKMNKITIIKGWWNHSIFDHLDAQHVYFLQVIAKETVYQQVRLENVLMTGNWTKLSFNQSSATLCSFNEMCLHEANLSGSRLINSDFSLSDLSHLVAIDTVFTKSRFVGTILKYTNLTNALFLHCLAQQADFTQANLTNTCFVKANIAEAIFEKALLIETDFADTEKDIKENS